jgi:hypothetical protein
VNKKGERGQVSAVVVVVDGDVDVVGVGIEFGVTVVGAEEWKEGAVECVGWTWLVVYHEVL